jgi:hypothetical protein
VRPGRGEDSQQQEADSKSFEGRSSGAGGSSTSEARTRGALVRSISHTQALQLGHALAAARWDLKHLSSFAARAGPANFSPAV